MATPHVDEWYTDYLEGTLPAAQRARVEAHLAACPSCAAALDEVRQAVAAVHALPELPVPEGFAAAVQARIRAPQPRPWGWTWAAGLAACLLAVTVFAGRMTAPPRVAAPPPAPRQVATAPERALPLPTPTVTYDFAPKAVPVPAVPKPVVSRPSAVADPFAGDAPRTSANHGNADHNTAIAEIDNQNKSTWGADAKLKGTAEVWVRADDAGKPLAIHVTPDNKISLEPMKTEGAKDAAARRTHTFAPAPAPAGAPLPANNATAGGGAGKAMADEPESPAGARMAMSATAATLTVADGDAVQPLALGELRVANVNLPAAKAGTVTLDVSATHARTVSWQPVLPMKRNAQRTLPVRDARTPVTIPAAATAKGTTLRLEVATAEQASALYLFTPGTTPAPFVTLNYTERPMVQAVQQLANDAGLYVLCSEDFAEQPVTFTVTHMRPLDALLELAAQYNHRVTLFRKSLANITPAK
jgi:hypothetical protein